MSSGLSQQILAILQLATEPLSTMQISRQLAAEGIANASDANKLLYQMRRTGAVVAVAGEGRALLWRLGTKRACERIRAKLSGPPRVKAERTPSFVDAVLTQIGERPGITSPELAVALHAHGHRLRTSEPSRTLNRMCNEGRVRFTGEKGYRRYFLADALPAKPAAAPKADPLQATPPAPSVSGLPGVDPIAALVESVALHLHDEDGWHTSAQLAEALDEPRRDISTAVAGMLKVGTVIARPAAAGSTLLEFAHSESRAARSWREEQRLAVERAATEQAITATAADPTPAESAAEPQDQPDTMPAKADDTPSRVDIPAAPSAPLYLTADAGLRELAAREAISAARPPQPAAAPPITGAMRLDDAGDPLITLGHLVSGIAIDIEDLIGRACDERADHRVIKALAGAAGMARRAQIDLLRAA